MTLNEQPVLEEITQLESEEFNTKAFQITAADICVPIIRRKALIAVLTLLISSLSATAIFLLPPSYKAEATVLPPQEQQSSLSAFAASAIAGLGAAGMGSQLGLKSPADLYIGILRSRTVCDDIIARFHLQDVYRERLLSDARKALDSHVTLVAGKDSLIAISVTDHNAHRAADMANAFIDELYKQNSRLAITDASQRRLFFEQQLKSEKEALASAELALKLTQQKTGLILPAGQAEVLIRSGAQLRTEIASREVQLQAMRAYATEENPQLQVLRQELSALKAQLTQVSANETSVSNAALSARNLPDAALDYIRKTRYLRYHETLYELLAKQYEAARIDEAKQAPVIQVIDRAIVPDTDSRPSRLILLIVSVLIAFVVSSLTALALELAGRLRTYSQRIFQLACTLNPY
jgi:tyrosine-protein kinase Etk/Wzc